MNPRFPLCVSLLQVHAFVCSCAIGQGSDLPPANKQSVSLAEVKVSPDEQATIRALIEQLVLADAPASNRPMRNPGITIYRADGTSAKPGGNTKEAEDYRKRFEACQAAFQKLAEFKMTAFPLLMEHMDDNRQSINFRNHHLANSVGDACKWNVYYQLVDTPENYSSYGYSRPGRDGKNHPKPAWEGTPFDDAGGVQKWLEENKALTYVEMQIKCLRWTLDREKAIGAVDPDSYFENILPLEVRILERRQQAGEDVGDALTKMRQALSSKDPSGIPSELLPPK